MKRILRMKTAVKICAFVMSFLSLQCLALTETVNGKEVAIPYNVYVVTYRDILKTNVDTVDAMSQVYLDSRVTNAHITSIKNKLGDEWHIHVLAEGCQAKGFDDAYEALNTSFGVPGTYNAKVDWTASTIGDTDRELFETDQE